MWLTIRSGGDEGKAIEVTGDRFVVGRDTAATSSLRREGLAPARLA